MSDIQSILRAWGKWSQVYHNHEMGYGQPMEAIMRGAPVADVGELRVARYDSADFISDDKALVVDRIVGNLCRIHPIAGQCLRLRYERGMTPDKIAKGYLSELEGKSVGRYKASQYIATAEGFVDGYIANM